MRIYIDNQYHCHTTNPDGELREVELTHFAEEFFNGKCQTFLEGHRYCPDGESYTREDGAVFDGECIVPWKDLAELEAVQREYERQQIEELEALVDELYAEVTS